MSREWQQTRLPEYIMPNAVYYQSLWAVRDLERMESRLEELEDSNSVGTKSFVQEKGKGYSGGSTVENTAMEAAILQERVDAIRNALLIVPERYRDTIMGSILFNDNISVYPSRMWKIWKQKFLFHVAKNLSMM